MGNSALDVTAIVLGAAIALAITAALGWALRDGNKKRGWLTAGVVFGVLVLLGVVDLLRHSPRETPFSTVVVGVALPVLGTLGILFGTRRVRTWLRWTLAFATAFLLVFGGLLLGTVLTRWIPV